MSGLDMMQVPPTPPDPWMVDRMDVGSADDCRPPRLSESQAVMDSVYPGSPPLTSQRERDKCYRSTRLGVKPLVYWVDY